MKLMQNEKLSTEVLIHAIFGSEKEGKSELSIVDGDYSFSFDDLKKTSFRIAEILTCYQVHKNSTIAVISERSFYYVATILALLMRGCAFVPIDASYPQERIKKILSDARTQAVLCLSDNINKTDNYNGIWINKDIVLNKSDISSNSIEGKAAFHCSSDGDALAYIMYTSGTTGGPKGVMISNKAIMNTLTWIAKEFSISNQDSIAFKTSISFTDSIWEIFIPLICNTKMIIINDKTVKNPAELIKYLSDHRVTITQFVPSMLNVVLLYLETKNIKNPLPDLRWVLNGGEYVTPSLVQRFYNAFKNTSYANTYGMTESAIYATCYIVRRQDTASLSAVPIGYPVTHTRVQLCDSEGNQCAIGCKGEIYISGISLSNGYFNSPEQTKDRFITDKINKTIMYRSGDIGFLDDNGCLWYCGRTDHQVKIRGNRVEIFEVESCIVQFPGIQRVAVIDKKDAHDETTLWCYLCTRVDIFDLKLYLKNKLPDFMIPQYYIILPEMPLTDNNKIDRTKLAQIKQEKTKGEALNAIMSDDPMVHKLFDIWRSLIGNCDFTEKDDFFEIGGDSIKAARMLIMLEKENISVSLEEIEFCRTIEKLLDCMQKKALDNTGVEINIGKPFTEFFYKDCFYNHLFTIVNYYGGNVMAFFSILRLYYEDNPNGCLGIKIHDEKLADGTILDRLGIRRIEYFDSDNLIEIIRNAIDCGEPIIVLIDGFFESIRKDIFQVEHLDHSLLVFGYENKSQDFSIIEHNSKNSLKYHPCLIGWQELLNAVNGYKKYFSKDNPICFQFKKNKPLEELSAHDYSHRFIRTYASERNELLNGLEQLNIFHSKLLELKNVKHCVSQNFDTALNELNHIINMKKLENYTLRYCFGEEQELLQMHDEVVKLWSYIRLIFLYLQEEGCDIAEKINEAAEKIKKISKYETKIVAHILNIKI
ncbi:hypothetical protein FACS1894105_06980 [Clostridia bacterium]|nr:hypothetical protein FACS1894105_06980 [Clostridia bacterium]